MRSALAGIVLAAPVTLAGGCLRSTSFTCADNGDCSGGFCEANNFCSFSDATCPSGRRYGDLSGADSNRCVGEEIPTIDAPPDEPDAPPGQPDAPPDAPTGCLGTYVTVSGQNNVYRVVTIADQWTTQQVTCANESAYLIVPDTQAELDAITALAAASIWVGLHDRTTEGSYVNVRGTAATFLPWAVGQPDDDPPGEDCVMATGSTISDERCNLDHLAVCECEP
jgi:hypothetical protein